ncbi:uncharacterized protein EAF01_000729 [Botrytis porri]|uniref:uncharacterized protein n=1 Tax=Botrytis porri TaxID=87229 RepID=UPI001900D1E9|nr:uncharacterized protein EAF01_000729 [Botrytis porri]KAF7914323.1 hypothetical protein EAF01_000729 [Botrytis porri]
MDRSRGRGRSLPAEDRRKFPSQAETRNLRSLPTSVGNSNRDRHGMIPRFESKHNYTKLLNTGRMADQQTRHTDKRNGGDRYRTHSKQFFAKGRVFSTAFEDEDGLSNQNFLVIREAQEGPDDIGTHCTCLSVTPLRKDLDLSECGLLHANSTQPPSIRGVKFKPLQVDISRDTRFDAPMLVNYIQMFNVDTNSEVNDIGKLRPESIQDMMDNFKDSLFDSAQDRNGRSDKHRKRKGRGEDESSRKPPHGHREPSKPHSKAQIASNTRSAPPTASGSSSVPNGSEAPSRRPKLRDLDVPDNSKRQKPKGSSHNSEGLEGDPDSPTRAREAENRRLQDVKNNQRRGDPLQMDQLRDTKDRHERDKPARRGEEGEIPLGSSRADIERGRGDEGTGRPGVSLLPHSPTKRNMNHRKDGDDISKTSTTGVPVPIPIGDSSDRGKQRDRNNPLVPRENASSRKEDNLKRNDDLPKDDDRPGNSQSRPQSSDREFNDGGQDHGSDWEGNDPIDGRRGQKGRGAPHDARDLPPPIGRRDDPTDGTPRRGIPPDQIHGRPGDFSHGRSMPGIDDRGRPLDRAGHDPRSMSTETSLPGRSRPNGLPGRDGKLNSANGGRPSDRAPDRRSMSNNPPPSRPNGRDPPQSNPGDRRQMRPPGYGAPDRSDPRSNNRRSISPRRPAPPAGHSRLPGGGSGGAPFRSQPPPSSRGRGPPPPGGGGPPSSGGRGPSGRGPPSSGVRGPSGRDGPPRRNLPPLRNPGHRSPGGSGSPMGGSSPISRGSPGGGYSGGRSPGGGRSPVGGSSPMSRGPPGGRSPGPSSPMSGGGSPRGSPGSLSPGNSMSSASPGGSPAGSPIESPAGSLGSPGGLPMGSPPQSPGSHPDSPMGSLMGSEIRSPTGSRRDSMASGSYVGSPQDRSPMGGSSYRSSTGSGPPSPAMSGRSRSLSPPPSGRLQSGRYSPRPGSPRSPSPGARSRPSSGGVRRRGPKGKPRGPANGGQPPSSGANNDEPYRGDDDGCGCCESGCAAWWKSVVDWWNGVGQEEWIQMDNQKDNGKQKSEPDQGPEDEDAKSVTSGADHGSPSPTKDPFEDGQDDESTAVGSDEENSDEIDDESEDENGSDQEDPDADARSNLDAESDQGSEDEEGADNSSAVGSRRSSTAVASEFDHQDSVREPADDYPQNPPNVNCPENENSYPAKNPYMEAPQDTYSYLPNDDRFYMGQHDYAHQNGYPTNPSDMPPQELDSAYPAAYSAKPTATAFPSIPEDAAELATDNSEPPNPPPYASMPSTPQQLSRPRSTRFELACERDPVELEVPPLPTTRGKSELFLPPSLTPGVATAPHNAFSPFSARGSARTPSPFHHPPMPQIKGSWAPPQQQTQFSQYQPQVPDQSLANANTNMSKQGPQANFGPSHSQAQAQSQPQLRSGMNYAPQVPQAPPPTYPSAQRYDARGNQFHEQAMRQPSPHQQQMRGTPPPVVPTRSEMRSPSFPPPLNSARGMGGAGVSSGKDGRGARAESGQRGGQDTRGKDPKSEGRSRGHQDPRNKAPPSRNQRRNYAESESEAESGSDSESEPDSDSDDESGSDDEHGYVRQRGMGEESGSDDDSDLDSGFGTYDDDLVGREDDMQSNHGGSLPQGPTGMNPRAGMESMQFPPPTLPAPAPRPVAAPPQAHISSRGVSESNHGTPNPNYAAPNPNYVAPNPYIGQNQMQMHTPQGQNQYQNSQPQIPGPVPSAHMQKHNSYQRPGDTPHNAHMPSQAPGHNQYNRPDDMYSNPYGRPEQQQEQQQQAPHAPYAPQPSANMPEQSGRHKPETQKSRPHKGVEESQRDVRGEKKSKEKNHHVEKPFVEKPRKKERPPVPMSPPESVHPQPGDEISPSPSRQSPFEQENEQDQMTEERDSESESGSDDESELEENLDSDPGSEGEESDGEGGKESSPHANEDGKMESDAESLAPPSPSLVQEKKDRKRRGEGDKSRGGSGKESGKGKERSRGGKQSGRGEKGGRERNGRGRDRRGRGREDGVDVGGKLKKTWDFLKKLDYHEK